jgi:hypothetical protein
LVPLLIFIAYNLIQGYGQVESSCEFGIAGKLSSVQTTRDLSMESSMELVGYIWMKCLNAYRKRPLGRPRHRLVDNIRNDLVEVGWGDVDWIGLAQDRDRWRAVVNSILNLRVP